MRLIDADALKEALHSFFDGKVINDPAYVLRDIFCHIDNAPTVERPQDEGEWIDTGNMEEYWAEEYQCSICGAKDHWQNFCPNCGAKMKGGAE